MSLRLRLNRPAVLLLLRISPDALITTAPKLSSDSVVSLAPCLSMSPTRPRHTAIMFQRKTFTIGRRPPTENPSLSSYPDVLITDPEALAEHN